MPYKTDWRNVRYRELNSVAYSEFFPIHLW
jgi:hypothetical protein